MTKITAPYSFVPLNEKVYLPEWGNQISHDVPFEDGEDGVATVTIKTLSPLFIKNTGDKDDKESIHVMVNGQKKFFIPGSSIKGMLRSTLEIMSFGKMQQFDDDFFGFRYFNTKIDPKAGYQRKMNDGNGKNARYAGKCGYLRKDDEDNYYIEDCGEPEPIEIAELKSLLHEYKGCNDNALAMNDRLKYPKVKGKTLVCTGKGINDSKQHEMLFGDVEGEKRVSKETIHKFLGAYRTSIYEDRTHLDKGVKTISERLNSMDSGHKGYIENRLPVFYHEDENGDVISLGITKMYRYPSKYSVGDLVKQGEYDKSKMDLAECIFGRIASNDVGASLKGRVTIGNAFLENATESHEISGVFGEPSASFFPLYLKQTDMRNMNTYNTDNSVIAGWKRYMVRPDGALGRAPQGNGNENVMTYLIPLEPGAEFKFKIVFHNMKPAEIGAVLSSLTFHNTPTCHHTISFGKAIGLGKIAVENIALDGLKSKDYKDYLRAYEKEMYFFTKSALKRDWTETDQICKLAAIASDHMNEKELEYMDLYNYGQAKLCSEVNDIVKDKELDVRLSSLLTKEDIAVRTFKSEHPQEYNEIKSFESYATSEECDKAKDIIECLLGQLKKSNDDVDYKEECEKELRDLGVKVGNKKAELLNKAIPSDDEKWQRPLSPKCVNSTMKPNTIAGNYKKWLDRNGEATEEDKRFLLAVLSDCIDGMKPRDKKELAKRVKWNQFNDFLGQETVDKWFNEKFMK